MKHDDLYFMQRQSDAAVKIGRSVDVTTRSKTLKAIFGNLEVLVIKRGAGVLESTVHDALQDARLPAVDGGSAREWFKPTADVMNFVDVLRGTLPLKSFPKWADLITGIQKLEEDPSRVVVARKTGGAVSLSGPYYESFLKFRDVLFGGNLPDSLNQFGHLESFVREQQQKNKRAYSPGAIIGKACSLARRYIEAEQAKQAIAQMGQDEEKSK